MPSNNKKEKGVLILSLIFMLLLVPQRWQIIKIALELEIADLRLFFFLEECKRRFQENIFIFIISVLGHRNESIGR